METLTQPAEADSSCVKCGKPTSLEMGAVMRGYGLQCNSCTNLYQIIYRHLGGLPDSLATMSSEQQKTFFSSAGEQLKVAPKNARWALVRKGLVHSLCHFKTEQTKTTVKRKFLPLTVWATKGH